MRIHPTRKASRALIAGVMLFAFAVRALVPQGFMPSGERPFSIEVCPEGFPAHLLAHTGHHPGGTGHSYNDHCVFGTACASGPPPQPALLAWILTTTLVRPVLVAAAAIVIRLVYLPQVRGPPAAI